MRIGTSGIVVLVLALFVPVLAHTGEPPSVLYRLQPASTYEEGCYGQCLCPILQAPLEGTFGLTLLPTAGPFDVYAVDPVDFVVPAIGKVLEGSGFYIPIGELNQLQLDLQIDGQPAQLFTSGGLVPKGAEFPDIDIVVSVNQMQSCFDHVLHIVASPDTSPKPGPALDVARADLSWSDVPNAAGYDVVCGSLDPLRGSGDFLMSTDLCLGDDLAASSTTYDVTPGAGQAVWFLVREEGGSYDSGVDSQVGSRDEGIDASAAGCP